MASPGRYYHPDVKAPGHYRIIKAIRHLRLVAVLKLLSKRLAAIPKAFFGHKETIHTEVDGQLSQPRTGTVSHRQRPKTSLSPRKGFRELPVDLLPWSPLGAERDQ